MKCTLALITLLLSTSLVFSLCANAAEYFLPANKGSLIGENKTVIVANDGRPLEAIAAKYQIGLLAMLEANPNTDPYLPEPKSQLIIPSQMLLPDTPHQGIIINLAELRLYYYPPDEKKVMVYPIGIGQRGRSTPIMITSVSQKIPNPTWTPTANIRKRYLAEGKTLPAVVPAGAKNPMGLFALRLTDGRGEYLIHGTNANFGIGLRVSSGCIRLRPNDIEALFHTVSEGTRVQIINQPIKFSIEPDSKRYIEVHQPLSLVDSDDPQTMPITLSHSVQLFISDQQTDRKIADKEIARRSGMPVVVTE